MLLAKNRKGKSALFFSNLVDEKTHTHLMIVAIITVTWGSTELKNPHTNVSNVKKGTYRL